MISRLAAGLTRHPAIAGAVLSLLSLPIHLVLPEAVSIQFAAVILGLVAGIYAGFALQDGRAHILAIEGLAALAFLAFALAGLIWSPWLIPAAGSVPLALGIPVLPASLIAVILVVSAV